MRETNFIKQNQEKWEEFEETLEKPYQDPDKLKNLFTQITDDLSFARTFYPNRSVRVYLNAIAQRTFLKIYKSKKSKRGRIASFWSEELPKLMWETRRELVLAFSIFMVAVSIGIISCMADADFIRIILGDAYVEMTKANIEKGDPMAVYKDEGAFGMFLGITANNIFVAFLAFLLGLTYIGTVGLLIRNGVMLGSFQYFFVEYDLFWESFLTVWMHGAFEISAIVLAGAAGLSAGKGLFFPGTLSRVKAFQVTAKRGMKIMLGLIPIFIAAGFIESYLTRHTELPDIFRALFILGCFAFMIGYFIIYPRRLAKAGHFDKQKEAPIPPDNQAQIDLSTIKENFQIFTDTFQVYRRYASKFFWLAVLGAGLYCLTVFLSSQEPIADLFFFPDTQLNAMGPLQMIAALFALIYTSSTLWEIDQFFIHDTLTVLPIINILIFSLMNIGIFYFVKKALLAAKVPIRGKHFLILLLKNIIVTSCCYGVIYIANWSGGFSFLLMLTLYPILLLWAYIVNVEEGNVFTCLSRTMHLMSNKYQKMLGLLCILMVAGFSFFLLFDTIFSVFIFQFIGLNLSFEQAIMDALAIIILTFMVFLMLIMIYALVLIGFSILYYSLLEIKEVPHLRNSILNIGTQQFIRGLERE